MFFLAIQRPTDDDRIIHSSVAMVISTAPASIIKSITVGARQDGRRLQPPSGRGRRVSLPASALPNNRRFHRPLTIHFQKCHPKQVIITLNGKLENILLSVGLK